MYVPLYILIPLALLAAVALLERVLLPPVRVMLRRRLRRLTEDIDARLKIKLQPFKLTRKKVVEEMLIHDPEVVRAAGEYRTEHRMSWDEVTDLVRVAAHEIVPRFDVVLYYRLAHSLARAVTRVFYRVRIRFLDRRAVAGIDPGASVIFVMNHRSNFDYLLVSYIVSRLASISYAVGEWARVWPLDTLLRRMGAYFVRRRASDPLYRKVLERFVQLSADSGVTQGIFPEGRLTRDGRLGEPKLGLLCYLLRRFDPEGPRDLVFVPVGLNYDRVLEDRTHALERGGERPRVSAFAAARTTARSLAKLGWLLVRGRFHRFGTACVTFGMPVSVKDHLAARGRDLRRLPEEDFRGEVEVLGRRLMAEVGRAVPVTPVALVAHAFLAAGADEVPRARLERDVAAALEALRRREVAEALPRTEAERLVELGVRALRVRRVLTGSGGVLAVAGGDRALLAYYANSIAHHVEAPAAAV